MKFSILALTSGVSLIVAPLLVYAYQLHVSETLAMAAIAAHGSFTFPELPVRMFFFSSVAGVALAVLGYRVEKQVVQASGGANKQA